MFAEFMEAYGMELIGAVLTAVLGFIGIAAKRMVQRWLDTKEKKEIAEQVVMFAEQVYKTLGGQEKLKIALDAARDMLADRGIDYSEAEMRILIESAVGAFNGAFWESRARHIETEITESAVDEEPEDNMTPETKAFVAQMAAEQEEIRARAKAYCEAHPECVREDKPEGK